MPGIARRRRGCCTSARTRRPFRRSRAGRALRVSARPTARALRAGRYGRARGGATSFVRSPTPDPASGNMALRLAERVVQPRRHLRHALAAAEGPRGRSGRAGPLSAGLHARRDSADGVADALLAVDQERRRAAVGACRRAVVARRQPGEIFQSVDRHSRVRPSAPGQALLREPMQVIGSRNKGRELLAVLNFLERRVKEPRWRSGTLSGIRGRPAAGRRAAGAVPDEGAADRRARARPRFARADPPSPARPGDRALGLDGVDSRDDEDLMSLVGSEQPRAPWRRQPSPRRPDREPAIAGGATSARWRGCRRRCAARSCRCCSRGPTGRWRWSRRSGPAAVLRNELTPTQIACLLAHRSAAVRALAAGVFEQAAPSDRRAVMQRYLAALDLRGNGVRGRTTYEARCAACHQPGADGTRSARGRRGEDFGKDEILTHLVDPNRTVDARYRLYRSKRRTARA